MTKGNKVVACLVNHSVRYMYFYLSLVISYESLKIKCRKLHVSTDCKVNRSFKLTKKVENIVLLFSK